MVRPVKAVDFVFAARPMLLLPVWSIYLVTYHFTNSPAHFDLRAFMILTAISLIMVGCHYINQIYDFQSDLINNKIGFLQKEFISKSEMVAGYLAVTMLGLTISIFQDFRFFVLAISMVISGYFYSAPPLRLKDRPLWGLLANGIGYGFLLILALPIYPDSNLLLLISLMVYFFLTVSAIYLLTIIIDRDGDKAARKNTLAVRFSDRNLIAFGSLMAMAASVIAGLLGLILLMALSALSAVLFFFALAKPQMPVLFFTCKFPILLLSLLAGYYYPVYLVFMLVLIICCRLYYRKRFGIIYPRVA